MKPNSSTPLGDSSDSTTRTTTLDRVLAESLSGKRLLMVLLWIFATIALPLAGIGLYGVVTHSMVQRGREIDIRMALGARRQDVFKLVIGQGTMLVVVGLVIGVVVALAATRVLQSYLYEIRPTDPFTFVCVPLLLAGVSLLACWLPARRAAEVDPMEIHWGSVSGWAR